MQILPDYIVKALDEIATQEGVSDYSLEYEAGSQHGDNFLGWFKTVYIVFSPNQLIIFFVL